MAKPTQQQTIILFWIHRAENRSPLSPPEKQPALIEFL